MLVAIAQRRRALEAAEQTMIERARQDGVSFAQIGKALGLTRQAIHARVRRAQRGPIAVGALLGYIDLTDAIRSLLG